MRAQELQHNLNSIKLAIQTAVSNSNTKIPVRLVAVSKTKPSSDVLAAYQYGQLHFGENYVQELVEKAPQLPLEIQWHFIGTCQSNKLKLLAGIPNMFVIETIDSLKKATILDKACSEREKKLKIFLQVNTSGEESKSGLSPQETPLVAKEIVDNLKNISLAGLMTIGSRESSQTDGVNPDFECLRNVRDKVEEECNISNLELSMGMSDDFVSAIRQGSTSVRVGSKIFGSR